MSWRLFLVGALCASVLAGCSEDSPTTVVPSAGTLKLQFLHNVAGQPLVFGSIQYANAAGDSFSVVRLNYLLSNIEVVASDGWRFLVPGPFFVNAAVDSTMQHVLRHVPPGTYKQIAFTFGLDESVNTTAAFLSEPWHGAMEWPLPLGGGYHYMILDGNVGGINPRAHNTHFGRTQLDPHYFKMTIDLPTFTVDGNETCIDLAFDVNQWYEDPNVYSFPDPAFIMDKPDVQEVLQANGATVLTAALAP
jgi:hypothetical protein